MSATVDTTYDVFVSHAASDAKVASKIAHLLDAAGLQTFHEGSLEPGMDIKDVLWQALAESRALIAIISPETPWHAMGMIEIGAAAAWNKPVFLILNGPSSTKLPAALSAYPVYPISRLEEVIREIRTGLHPLSDEERDLLVELYRKSKTPTDQLNQSPRTLRELTEKFNRSSHRTLSGERLLLELLRMRKHRLLPRLREPKATS